MSKLREAIRSGLARRVVAIAVVLLLGAGGVAQAPREPDPTAVTVLSQEVAALQTLYALDATKAQLESLRRIARETAAPPIKGIECKVSDAYKKKLRDLREALVKAADEERIGELMDQIDELKEKEKPELADDVDVTEAAAERAPEVLRMLTAGQVAAFLGGFAGDIIDPRQRLLEALDKVRGLSNKEWTEVRGEISEDIGRLVAGLDDEKSARISARVLQLLIVARSMKSDEFKAERPELEKQAQQILGDIGPTDVLRHVMENSLAELLSNPCLPAALEARLKKESP
jgi:hypothetical protein